MTAPPDAQDLAFMRAAIAMAARGAGRTWPNPSVGCVIVRDGHIIAAGRTADGGRPHAETAALAMAGAAAAAATAYVTLEPCAHHGQTPPCADALAAAGIARVVIACTDPDPRVNGQGIAVLRAAGIAVLSGVLAAQAEPVLRPFFMRLAGRPMLTLKLAATLDGRIATAGGESRWITGPEARAAVHRLRGQHDAVMVGSGTALADDPDLTCRLPGFAGRGVRVLWDSRARLPHTHRLADTANAATWLLHGPGAPADHLARLRGQGVELIEIPAAPGNAATAAGLDPHAALAALAARGLTSVLAECGGRLAASLLAADLVDRLIWFSAPAAMGGDGVPALAPMGVAAVATMPRFTPLAVQRLGDDLCQVLERRRETAGA